MFHLLVQILFLSFLICFKQIASLNTDAKITPPSVIIIGAGPAGIAAGTRLYERGIKNILWLEAENRIGGRINTIKYGENVIDLGAQWCHGEVDNIVFKMAEPLGLLEHSNFNLTRAEFYDSNGQLLSTNDTRIVYEKLEELGLNDTDIKSWNSSLGDLITKKFNEILKTDLKDIDPQISRLIFDWYHKMINSLSPADSWFETSVKAVTEFKESNGDLHLNWKGKGYHTILNILMKKIPDPTKLLPIEEKIILNKEVINIKWDNNQNGDIIVRCKDNTEYKANYVLVTTSLGVLKERVNSLFTPPLPSIKQQTITGLGFGVVDKLFFEYPHRWWPENHPGFCFVWTNDDKEKFLRKFNQSEDNSWLIDVFAFDLVAHQPNILMGWICGEAARKMEQLSDDEVQEKLIYLLETSLGKHFNIPKPISFVRSKWYSNPHFRGSYSTRTMTSEKLNVFAVDLARPLKNSSGVEVVFFAGEATHSHFFATVHGAIESGWREAERILKLLI